VVDEDVAGRVHRQVERAHELAVAPAIAAPGAEERPVGGEVLDAVVPFVGDVERPVRGEGDRAEPVAVAADEVELAVALPSVPHDSTKVPSGSKIWKTLWAPSATQRRPSGAIARLVGWENGCDPPVVCQTNSAGPESAAGLVPGAGVTASAAVGANGGRR